MPGQSSSYHSRFIEPASNLESGVTQWLDTFESAIDYVISSGSLIPRTLLETSLAAASGSPDSAKLAWPPLGDSPPLDNVSRQWELHDSRYRENNNGKILCASLALMISWRNFSYDAFFCRFVIFSSIVFIVKLSLL